MQVKAIKISENQYIYIEVDSQVDDTTLPKSQHIFQSDWTPTIPDHASACGPIDDAIDVLESLQQNIKILAETVHASFQANQPEEWSLELNIGFKGKTSPIPVILSGEASGAIKVCAKWKKNREL